MQNRSQVIGAQAGFSLIELAIVLMIIGALIGSIVGTLGSRIENSRYRQNQAEMDAIKLALYGYAASRTPFHLPCPDCRDAITCPTGTNIANDGKEDRNGAVCDTDTDGTLGNLPWQTLGVGEKDPWGHRYSYWVSDTATDNLPPGFGLKADFNNATIETRVGENIQELTDSAAAVVFSHGANGYGAISVDAVLKDDPTADDEVENTNNDNKFVSRNVTEPGSQTSGGDDFEFDDVVFWISEYELKGKWVQASSFP